MVTTRRRKDTVVRRQQIVDAAQKVITRHGSEHVTVRRIAKEVGISEGAIYRHFKSKREILSLLADYTGDYLLQDIEVDPAVSGSTWLESLDIMLRSQLSTIQQRRGISFQVIAEIISLGDKRLNRKISDIIDKYMGRIKDILSQGIKTGEVREDVDLEASALVLFGSMQALVNIWYLNNYSFDPEEKYAHFWNIFRRAIARR